MLTDFPNRICYIFTLDSITLWEAKDKIQDVVKSTFMDINREFTAIELVKSYAHYSAKEYISNGE